MLLIIVSIFSSAVTNIDANGTGCVQHERAFVCFFYQTIRNICILNIVPLGLNPIINHVAMYN